MENNKKCSSKEHEKADANTYCQEEIFFGLCQENNHFIKLEYFCKTHNKLCCSSCIAKVKREGNCQHTDCDVCTIEEI